MRSGSTFWGVSDVWSVLLATLRAEVENLHWIRDSTVELDKLFSLHGSFGCSMYETKLLLGMVNSQHKNDKNPTAPECPTDRKPSVVTLYPTVSNSHRKLLLFSMAILTTIDSYYLRRLSV